MGRWSRPIAARFLNWLDLPRGLDWLNLGCGTGALTEAIVARCAPASIIALAAALREMRRIVRPGGTIGFYVCDDPGGGVAFMRAF